MSGIFSSILPPNCPVVLVLALVEGFLLELFPARNRLAPPNHFAGASAYTKIQPTNTQMLATSLCCGHEHSSGNVRLFFPSFESEDDKAGKKCFHLSK